MPNLKDIKNRINNVKISEKITLSMKNISSAKLAQARKVFYSSQEYISINNKILKYLLLAYKENEIIPNDQYIKHIFTENKKLPTLLVVIGSDRGLCGGFNSNIIKITEKLIKDLEIHKKKYLILPVGNKIAMYFSNKHSDKVLNFDFKVEIKLFNSEQILKFSSYILELFVSKKVGSINFVFTDFISMMNNIPVVKKVMPIDLTQITNNKNDENNINIVTDDFIYSIINDILKDYFMSWSYKTVISSLTSEYSSRVNAMENSYNNAKDLQKRLSLQYNRTRQSLITRELTEIISGMEAL